MSITPFRYVFKPIKRGFDFEWSFFWFDDAGDALNLTGSTVSCILWDRKREVQLAVMGLATISLNPGNTRHFLTAVQTAALEGPVPYELRLLEPDGSLQCYMDGIMPFVDFLPP